MPDRDPFLVGVVIADPSGHSRMALVSLLSTHVGYAIGKKTTNSPMQHMPIDEIYERALTATVQVIVLR